MKSQLRNTPGWIRTSDLQFRRPLGDSAIQDSTHTSKSGLSDPARFPTTIGETVDEVVESPASSETRAVAILNALSGLPSQEQHAILKHVGRLAAMSAAKRHALMLLSRAE